MGSKSHENNKQISNHIVIIIHQDYSNILHNESSFESIENYSLYSYEQSGCICNIKTCNICGFCTSSCSLFCTVLSCYTDKNGSKYFIIMFASVFAII